MNRGLRTFFIPSPENSFFPHSLRPQAILFYILVAVLVKLISFSWVAVLPKTDLFATISSKTIIALTNEARGLQGLSLLTEDLVLTQAAHEKALDMVEKKYFAHTSPEGKTPWYWFQKTGYNFKYAGENLAIDFFESEDVVRAWLNSENHRANILNENYNEIGIAVVNGDVEGKSTTLVVQLFGAPKPRIVPTVAAVSSPSPPLKPKTSPGPASPKPSPAASPEPTEFTEATPAPEASPERVAGIGSQSPVRPEPLAEIGDEVLNAVADPRWFYYLMIGYMIFAFAFGTPHYKTVKPEIITGTVLALMVIVGMIYLPDAQTMFGLQARVTP